ncbi:hypothetical protein Q8A67_021323 [Cirrhinus molitorella]|uniref:Uncharacterized protein n=1 Tax=Cirrhinus molitorella TaxID=172907 RepID=A0AA88P3C1_9TELE|nr:hypothetical protein Q8A67_021323 [Cirrhinus molitorella]
MIVGLGEEREGGTVQWPVDEPNGDFAQQGHLKFSNCWKDLQELGVPIEWAVLISSLSPVLAGLRLRLRKAAPAVVTGASTEWKRKALSLQNNPAFVELLEAISQKSNDLHTTRTMTSRKEGGMSWQERRPL